MAINLKDIDPDSLYDTVEAAKKINTTAGTLANRRVAGQPPKYVKAGNRVRYTGKSLVAHLLGLS